MEWEIAPLVPVTVIVYAPFILPCTSKISEDIVVENSSNLVSSVLSLFVVGTTLALLFLSECD